LLVRPHPANAAVYEALELPSVAVWPRGGNLPDTESGLQVFADSLRFSVGAIGVNTSGMIDTIIADKPCIAIITDEYARTQKQTLHFQHLHDSGALDVVSSIDECARRVSALIAGDDRTRPQRRAFVRSFIRPRGDVAASKIAARAIELLALHKDAQTARRILDEEFAEAPEDAFRQMPEAVPFS
jgi:hypothetical protein